LQEVTSLDYRDFLRKLPKVELHVHLNGTIRAQTVLELAKKNGVDFPVTEAAKVYHFPYTGFFQTLQLVSSVVYKPSDFARIAYEFVEDSAKYANVKYQEIFLNPTLFPTSVTYKTMVEGIVDGLRAARVDHGVTARIIPCVYRGDSSEAAHDMVQEVIDHRVDEVIGIGLDGLESVGPPERFVEAFDLAARAGLHRTAHAGEDGPSENITTCLDLLKCERIDHGYAVLENPKLVQRVRDEGVFFNIIIRAWAKYTGFEHHPVKEMDRRGIKLTIGSDDPPMQHGDLGLEYIDAAVAFNWGPDKMCSLATDAIEGTWLSDDEKRLLRQDFEEEIEALREVEIRNLPPPFLPYFRGQWWATGDAALRRSLLTHEDTATGGTACS
jgi:adenosine deaminase